MTTKAEIMMRTSLNQSIHELRTALSILEACDKNPLAAVLDAANSSSEAAKHLNNLAGALMALKGQ